MWHVGGTGEFIQGFGGGKERDKMEDRRRGEDNIKIDTQ
jgi:hypothetical protein